VFHECVPNAQPYEIILMWLSIKMWQVDVAVKCLIILIILVTGLNAW